MINFTHFVPWSTADDVEVDGLRACFARQAAIITCANYAYVGIMIRVVIDRAAEPLLAPSNTTAILVQVKKSRGKCKAENVAVDIDDTTVSFGNRPRSYISLVMELGIQQEVEQTKRYCILGEVDPSSDDKMAVDVSADVEMAVDVPLA